MENMKKGFDPFVFDNSEILILGSFPSVKSREINFYYGHPQNRFWKVLAITFGENIPKTIEDKKELCQKHKIALWDVIVSSDLNGSSDLNLEKSNFTPADLNSLLINYPNITKILCNGKLAFKLYQKLFNLNKKVVCMPSTSPANTRFDIDIWKNELLNKF